MGGPHPPKRRTPYRRKGSLERTNPPPTCATPTNPHCWAGVGLGKAFLDGLGAGGLATGHACPAADREPTRANQPRSRTGVHRFSTAGLRPQAFPRQGAPTTMTTMTTPPGPPFQRIPAQGEFKLKEGFNLPRAGLSSFGGCFLDSMVESITLLGLTRLYKGIKNNSYNSPKYQKQSFSTV